MTELEPITGELVDTNSAALEHHDDEMPRVLDLVRAWLLAQRSQHTADGYRRDIVMWLEWCAAEGTPPLSVRRRDADKWARWMEATPHGRYNRVASRATVNRRLAAISSFYDYCVKEEEIEVNRVKSAKRHEMDQTHSETFTPSAEEARRILAKAREWSPRAWAFTVLMVFTGARVSEVINADVAALRTVNGKRVLRVVRKRGKVANLPFRPAELVGGAVDAYLAGRTTGPLFLDRSGNRWTRQAASNEIGDIGVAVGCPLLTPHGLRHLFASLATIAGAKKDDLQEIMGHSDSKTTERYINNVDRFKNHPGEMIAELLGFDL